MRQRDENYISMCYAVRDVLEDHRAEWESLVALHDVVEDFSTLLTNMSQYMRAAEVVSTGATKDKARLKLAASQLAAHLSQRCRAYALEMHLHELRSQLRPSVSLLMKAADTLCLAQLRSVHKVLSAHVSALADYGVHAVDLDTLDELINSYAAVMARPRVLVVQRKTYNQGLIPETMGLIRESLQKIDDLMTVHADTPLGHAYHDARLIVDLGRRSR